MVVTRAQVTKVWENAIPKIDTVLDEADWEALKVPCTLQTKGLSYGNWCGPGTKVDNITPPVDAMDLMCKLHDASYRDVSLHPLFPFQSNWNADMALSHSVFLLKEN